MEFPNSRPSSLQCQNNILVRYNKVAITIVTPRAFLFAALASFISCSNIIIITHVAATKFDFLRDIKACERTTFCCSAAMPTSSVLSHVKPFSSWPCFLINSNVVGCNFRGRRQQYPRRPIEFFRYDDMSKFSNHCRHHHRFSMRSSEDPRSNHSFNDDSNNNDDDEATNNNEIGVYENIDVVANELSWRVAKVRLEEANTKQFLNRKPLKMSYLQSRLFIQRNWGPIRTKKEFEDLVSNGYLRTPYISKRPEEYYSKRGEWISWDHYLLGECHENNDNISGGIGFDGKNATAIILKWQ